MLQKILKRITNNFGLKVLAAVIAIVLWLVIVNTEDPEKTMRISTTVDIINAEYLEEQGQTYEVLNNTDKITFNITGQRSVVEHMKASDFTVTADLSDIENNSQVPITILANRNGNEITISSRSKYVEVYVEDIVEKKIPVEVETTGNVADGFKLSDLQANIEAVTVRGPESIVESIYRAVAWVEVESIQADTATTTTLSYYDEAGNTIDTSRLTMDHTNVSVSIGVMEQKTVPVEYDYEGTPAAGHQVVSVTGNITSVEILGKSERISQIDSIVVSGAQLNITGADQTIEKTIDITEYLPEGVALAADQESTVKVTILLETETVKVLQMPVSNIIFANIPAGYQVKASQDTVDVSIKGYPSEMEGISATALKGTVDASRIREGEQTLSVVLDGNYQVDGVVQVTVQVTKQEEQPPAQDPSGGIQDQ